MKLTAPAGTGRPGTAKRRGSAGDFGNHTPTTACGFKPVWPLILVMLLGLAGFNAGAQALPMQGEATQTDAATSGQQLAQKILSQTPPESSTASGRLLIRGSDGERVSIPLTCVVLAGGANWESIYQADFTNRAELLWIDHTAGRANHYFQATRSAALSPNQLASMLKETNDLTPLPVASLMSPFAGSDFCAADLGLEFLHWPGQKVLKLDIHRSRGCTVLESTTPTPTPPGYVRVVSWIDNETLGILEAYAYDKNGQKLKDFYPKDFKKVNGQWQVQTLVMDNAQTGSRSRLEFDLKK
jgi:hypothetical protein